MSMCLRKGMEKSTMYQEKNIEKHQHEFDLECILEVTNKNTTTSSMYYGDKEYYHVWKCNHCNSFKSIEKRGNCQGNISTALTKEQLKLPLIKADTMQKNQVYDFCKLENISFFNKSN